MRILLFSFAELGGLGGVEVVVRQLARGFRAQGHESGIIEIAPQTKPQREIDGVPVWAVSASSNLETRRPRSWFSFSRSAAQFLGVTREFRPDIVHVHFPLSQCEPVVAAQAMRPRWKLVTTVHNSDIRKSALESDYVRKWQSRIFRHSDAVTAVSEGLLQDTISLYPHVEPVGHVVLNGVGNEWFQQPAPDVNRYNEDFVIFAGRLNYVKGVDVLLRAWSKLGAAAGNTKLWLAGDGPDEADFRKLADDLNLNDSVRFLGRTTQDQLRILYRDARFLVLPSRREGLPLTLLEAGACGAICVGTDISGIPDILKDGYNGFVVPSENPDALSAAMQRVLALDADSAGKIKRTAEETVRTQFSELAMVNRYLDLFRAIQGQPKAVPRTTNAAAK